MSTIRIPDDFTVWAFADPHGVRSGLAAALEAAGLVDAAGHWAAPAGTALVGCGDYIDRGLDSAGVIELLFRLRLEAEAAGSLVALCWGNHEAFLESVLAGHDDDADNWLRPFVGGDQTAASFGVSKQARRAVRGPAHAITMELLGLHPEIQGQLALLVDAVIWRDVLFSHAGPAPGYGPEDLGTRTFDHLWQNPSAFYRTYDRRWQLDGPDYAAYRAAGIDRFVFGHESHEGPAFFQAGRAFGLDTNATAGAPGIFRAAVTLARIAPEGSLEESECVVVDTSDAPDRAPD